MFIQSSDLVRASEYRKIAAQCQQMAETSENPEDRARWFRIADKWLERAVEADYAAAPRDIGQIDAQGPQAAPDLRNLHSGESYVGYGRASDFASPDRLARDKPATYRAATDLSLNAWSLAGNWTVGSEFGLLNEKGGSIRYRFHARDLHLVLGPGARGKTVRFRVSIDGAPPLQDRGVDVDGQGNGMVSEYRLYQLIRQKGDVKDRTFQIEFLDPGVQAFASGATLRSVIERIMAAADGDDDTHNAVMSFAIGYAEGLIENVRV